MFNPAMLGTKDLKKYGNITNKQEVFSWSVGAMEYWSVVKEKPVFGPLLHRSSTPILRKYSGLIAPTVKPSFGL